MLSLLLLFMVVYFFKGQNLHATWSSFFIKPMEIPFGDLQSLVAAITCTNQGLDPMVINPCDVGSRGLLLPRTWLVFELLGLSAATIHWFAILFVAQLLIAFCALVGVARKQDAVLGALLCFSPAVLLGIERVNSDLLTFVCLTLSAYLFSRSSRAQHLLSAFVLFLATALKLYPVVGVAMLCKGRSFKLWRYATVFLVLALLFVAAIWSDIEAIRSVDSNRHVYGVGHDMVWLHLFPLFSHATSLELIHAGWRLLEGVVLAVIAVWLLRHRAALHDFGAFLSRANGFHLNAFVLGSSCYLALFIMHSFYDYKLLLLVLIFPLLVWVKNHAVVKEQVSWAKGVLLMTFLLMWTGMYFWWSFYDQAFGVDLREVPWLYYGSLVVRFTISWGVWIGLCCALTALAVYRWTLIEIESDLS
ncbi:MAG: hypothetical protein CMH56_08280 [Myxococcales bacterium]|nr:hypothetical protein [Myxococcales bacterium]